jgi:hypothetical protein
LRNSRREACIVHPLVGAVVAFRSLQSICCGAMHPHARRLQKKS